MGRRIRRILAVAVVGLLAAATVEAQRVTTPMQQFGHEIGADYVLPDYTQLMAYWQKLAGESDRMVLDTIGLTEEGRPQLMAIITSPENHRNLDRYKEINRRISMAEGLNDEQARQLIGEAKPVVWFDGGLHATEVLGAQQLMETVYQLVSATDAETMRFLDDLIILAVHANPDGMELVSDWYMREPNPEDRSTGGLPRLYQKYTGHDNNRDFYGSTQSETENMNRVAYIEWNPIILYNHHQTGPAGTVMFSPPFRDPPNYYFDPAILTGLEIVGGAMHDRFVAENKPGVTSRSGASYSTWWNGGLRTMAYFHNIIGLLTETIGNPTPTEIPFIPSRIEPESDTPFPIEPQEWHFRQSIDYSVTANKAVFDIASKRGVDFLWNKYLMAKRAIEKGSTDTWTDTPADVAMAMEELSGGEAQGGGGGGRGGGFGRGGRAGAEEFRAIMRDPALRDPRGYILPSDQPDFPTAAKFLEALAETGVYVHRASAEFEVAGKTYPMGSFVVTNAQPYRAHVMDMFEPQHHPSDLAYPGGPPVPPYDVAGWTLAYQMGVEFDRILEPFDGPFELVPGFKVPPMPGRITGSGNAGWYMSHTANDAFVAINRLMEADRDVFWLNAPVTAGGTTHPVGTFFIPRGGAAERIVQEMAETKGLNFVRAGSRPNVEAFELQPIRIGLWDRLGGSMPSGWVRWLLEQFEFPFEVVYPQTLDAGNLNRQFDVLIFVDGAIPSGGGGGRGGGGGDNVPAEYQHMAGNVSVDRTVPQLRAFMEAGGTVITIGSSTVLAEHLNLPIGDALTRLVDGEEQSLPRSEYYIPGSVLQARVDNTQPVAHGLPERVDFFFDNSPVMKLLPAAMMEGVRPIAWFDSPEPLRSGWGHGMRYLQGGVAAASADIGQGKLYLFGPEITFRAQPHGTFKLLFNGIYHGAAARTTLR